MPYASSTAIITENIASLFSGAYTLLDLILPYAVGILIFYIGWNWARRALGGK